MAKKKPGQGDTVPGLLSRYLSIPYIEMQRYRE
jgi:hypothetical protein